LTGLLAFLRLLYRFPALLLHVLIGTPATVLCQTAPGRALQVGGRPLSDRMLCWWARTVCRIFGLRRRVRGQFAPGSQLIAANHISWIDIQLLHSESPMGFVAKAEIEGWPLIGGMARMGGTVFHRRGSHDSASGVAAAMTGRLREGGRVAIFPEGGILDGTGVKRFHARLFGAAIDAGAPVQPVMLRYSRGGELYSDITFRPGEHFLHNFLRLLLQEPCLAELHVLEPLPSANKQRRQLSVEAESAVRAAWDSELPRD
jgi:1-acyl-sn-glycerol-3-phosphate acyltransferase